MATNRGIRLHWACSHYVLGRHDGVRVRIDATGSCGMPTKVFGYRLLLTNPRTGLREGFFSHVCSPPDLADYPEDGPVAPRRPEWFRLAYVDVFLRSIQEAEDFIQCVRSDVRRLKATLDTMDTLIPEGDEDIGNTSCLDEESSMGSQGSEAPLPPEPEYGATESVSGDLELAQGLGVGYAWRAPGFSSGHPAAVLLRGAGSYSQWLLLQGLPGLADIPDGSRIVGVAAELSLGYETLCPDLPGACPGDPPIPQSNCAAGPPPYVRALYFYHPVYGFSPRSRSAEDWIPEEISPIEFGAADDLWGWQELLLDARRGELGLVLCVATRYSEPPEITLTRAHLTLYFQRRLN